MSNMKLQSADKQPNYQRVMGIPSSYKKSCTMHMLIMNEWMTLQILPDVVWSRYWMNDVGHTVFITVNRYRHGRRLTNLGVLVAKWWAYFAPSTPWLE